MGYTRTPLWARAAALLIGLLAVLPYLGYHFEYLPGDLYDSRLNIYFLEHGYKWISGQTPHSFIDAPFFYPARRVLTYSDNLVGSLPFYIPWRWLGFDRETSFQIWVVIGFLVNYLSAGFVLKKLQFHWLAVLAGAYVFAFSQVALTHLWHIQLHYRFAMPLACYFLWRFLEQFSWKTLAWCALFIIWQFCCSPYEGYFLALFLTAFFLATVARKRVFSAYVRQASAGSVAAHGVVTLGCVVALAVLLGPYMHGSNDPNLIKALRQETMQMLPRPVSYLVSYAGNLETGWLYSSVTLPLKYEHIMFVGLIPWVCVLFLLATARSSGRKPVVTAAILAMFGVIALTLYINGISLYLPLMHLPAVAGIRAVTRSILVLLLPFSIAVAQAVHLLRERVPPEALFRRALPLLLLAALVAENHTTPYRFSKAEAQQRVRALTARFPTKMPDQPVLAYLNPTAGFERQVYDLDAMLAAQASNIPTVIGYSGREPKGYRPLRSCKELKLVLDGVPRQNDVFPLPNPESHVVTLGTPADVPCSNLNGPADNMDYARIISNIRRTVENQVPSGSHVLVITKGDEQMVRFTGRTGWHFPRGPDGLYAGYNPANSTAAIEHLEALRDQGAEYLLLPRTAFWWWDFYTEMHSYVKSRYPQIWSDASCVIYHLSPAPGHVQGIEGNLDVADAGQIAGWAWDTNLPNRAVKVEIYDEKTLLATVPADLFRKDLLDAHKGDGRHGFRHPDPFKAARGSVHTIRVLVAGTGMELVGSPVTRAMR
jgi:hypothetical protein